MNPPINWQPIATNLAIEVRKLPCTCVDGTQWPFKKVKKGEKEFQPHKCQRCKSLEEFDVALAREGATT